MGLLKEILECLLVTPEYVGKKGERITADKLEWSNLGGI